MAVTGSVLCTCFFILLPAVAAESGSEAPMGCESCADAESDAEPDAEPDAAFTCFTQLADHILDKVTLICNVSGMNMGLNEDPLKLTVCLDNNCHPCSVESRLEHKCSVDNDALYSTVDVCLMLKDRYCRALNVAKIIKPEAPFGLNVTYQENEDGYLVRFSAPLSSQSYLKNVLQYEITYWPENTTSNKTKGFGHVPATLLRKEFQPGTKYEAKVRSKPIKAFFDGSWSEWSSSAHFQTSPTMPDKTSIEINLMIAFCGGFIVLLVLISLIPVFWKNRIKPLVWPAIPNHEKALDKLCNKLRKNSEISVFDPESFGYAHIHKVDNIQAKSEITHFPQPLLPWATNIPETVGIGLEPKNNLSHINHGWLKLSQVYEGMWPAERLNWHLGRSNPVDHDVFTGAGLNSESAAGGQHGYSDAPSTPSSALLDPSILPGLGPCQADPGHQTYANSEVRVSNKEEAYVTMASFFESKGNWGN